VETCIKLREIEALKETVITFLTARAEDYSHIAGLEAGADDYIYKPIKPRLLITRIKALLKRSRSNDLVRDSKVEGIIIDKDKYVVIVEGEKFHFPKKEFELLSLLVSNPEHVFTREEIMNKVWGFDAIVGDRTIDVHIRKLREKLGDKYIRTIKGVGYKFLEWYQVNIKISLINHLLFHFFSSKNRFIAKAINRFFSSISKKLI